MTPEENEQAREEAIVMKINKILRNSKSSNNFSLPQNINFQEFGINNLEACAIYSKCHPNRLQNIKFLSLSNCLLDTLEQVSKLNIHLQGLDLRQNKITSLRPLKKANHFQQIYYITFIQGNCLTDLESLREGEFPKLHNFFLDYPNDPIYNTDIRFMTALNSKQLERVFIFSRSRVKQVLVKDKLIGKYPKIEFTR